MVLGASSLATLVPLATEDRCHRIVLYDIHLGCATVLTFFAGNRKLIWRQASLLGTCMYAYIYIMCIRLVNKNVRWPLQIKEDSQQNHVEPMNHAGFFADRAKVVWIPEYRNWMELVTRGSNQIFQGLLSWKFPESDHVSTDFGAPASYGRSQSCFKIPCKLCRLALRPAGELQASKNLWLVGKTMPLIVVRS